jgi:ferredoxin/flavodoxin---NADP+ reductase
VAYAITQNCCTDASCVSVCPVNCIHPTPDEPDFGHTDLLYVDPAVCIDCGACSDACPVDAVHPVDLLTGSQQEYARLNAEHFAGRAAEPVHRPNLHAWGPPTFAHDIPADLAPLDVAVVGTGPAGMYTVAELLLHTNAKVTLIDRLPVPGGLIRYGVAPDHPATRGIGESFQRWLRHPRLRLKLGVEVGRDVTAAQLAARHDAVVYAVGAPTDRRLGLPGEDRPGSLPATTVVGWYNGHPEVAPDAVDLSAERAVVVGTGNVALDVARVLTADPAALAATPIAPAALEALRHSNIREVVLLGRRGPESAAYTAPELLALARRENVDLVVDRHDPRVTAAIDAAGPGDKAALLRGLSTVDVNCAAPPGEKRRLVLRFHSAPVDLSAGLTVTGGGGEQWIDAGLVIRAIGHRGVPLPGLPFDETTGTVPNDGGRVTGLPGAYVVGWIKRGPAGGIGANRTCARETVRTLLADVTAAAPISAAASR